MTDKIAPVHPGEVLLEEFLKPARISQNQLAKHMNTNASKINEIVRARRGITGNTALRLAKATNTTPEFWLTLQNLYDIETAKDDLGDTLEQEVTLALAL